MKDVVINKTCGRIAWIDNARFFAILCVILYHSSQLVSNEYYYAGWIIESFNMALFFFLSGLTSYRSIGKIESLKDWLDFFKKKFIRIMLPCMFVSLLVFQKPCSFWFLLTLFYYLIAFASFHYICSLFRISRNWAFLLFLLLVFVSVPKVGNDQEFIVVFALGLYFSKINVIEKLSDVPYNRILWVTIIGFALWLLLLPFYKSFYLNQFYDLLHSNMIYLFPIRQVTELSFAIACCLLFMKQYTKLTKFSKWGGQTLGLYIIHVTILTICENHHWAIDARGHLWGNFLEIAGFIVLTIVSMFLVNLLGKWKWSNFLVLGNKLG